jgi:uncharacterized SAM-dependent methyltransferase
MRQPNDIELSATMLHLIAEKHVLPLKFAYTGRAAKAHLRLAALDSYKEVTFAATAEAKMVVDNLPTRDLFIADIGLGDGRHSADFLRELHQNGRFVSEYIGFDFSTELMVAAEQRIKTVLSSAASFRRWDVEAGPTNIISAWHEDRATPLLVSFLGQTLGNFEVPLTALCNIRGSVEVGDRLLLSVALQVFNKTADDYLRPYRNSVFMEAIAEPLRMAGLRVEREKLIFTYEDNAVIGKFTLEEDQIIDHPLRQRIILLAGTTIRCFMSRRFDPKEIETTLQEAGWMLMAKESQNQGEIGVYLASALA